MNNKCFKLFFKIDKFQFELLLSKTHSISIKTLQFSSYALYEVNFMKIKKMDVKKTLLSVLLIKGQELNAESECNSLCVSKTYCITVDLILSCCLLIQLAHK